jgi:uncharacterized protein YciI
MHIVFLRFGANRSRASEFMSAHKEWLERGFADGVFVLSGTISPSAGGAILAHGLTTAELEARINDDPFVVHGVVTSQIEEVAASRADDRVRFLLSA